MRPSQLVLDTRTKALGPQMQSPLFGSRRNGIARHTVGGMPTRSQVVPADATPCIIVGLGTTPGVVVCRSGCQSYARGQFALYHTCAQPKRRGIPHGIWELGQLKEHLSSYA